MSFDDRKLPEEPAGKIDKVNALVYEFPTAGKRWISSPFRIISSTSSVTVSGAQKHEWPQCAFVNEFPSPLHGRMEAVIVSNSNCDFARICRFKNLFELRRLQCAGLFYQNVLSCVHALKSDWSERHVRCGYDDE